MKRSASIYGAVWSPLSPLSFRFWDSVPLHFKANWKTPCFLGNPNNTGIKFDWAAQNASFESKRALDICAAIEIGPCPLSSTKTPVSLPQPRTFECAVLFCPCTTWSAKGVKQDSKVCEEEQNLVPGTGHTRRDNKQKTSNRQTAKKGAAYLWLIKKDAGESLYKREEIAEYKKVSFSQPSKCRKRGK